MEMVVVVAIIGLIAGISLPSITAGIDSVRLTTSTGLIASWSADNLIYTPDPPAYYGMIDFEEGGRLMMDFADVQPNSVEVGSPMRMVFRVKDHDTVRGFNRYFWKARPAAGGA